MLLTIFTLLHIRLNKLVLNIKETAIFWEFITGGKQVNKEPVHWAQEPLLVFQNLSDGWSPGIQGLWSLPKPLVNKTHEMLKSRNSSPSWMPNPGTTHVKFNTLPRLNSTTELGPNSEVRRPKLMFLPPTPAPHTSYSQRWLWAS